MSEMMGDIVRVEPIDTVVIKPKLQLAGSQGICPKCGAIVLPGAVHKCTAGNALKPEPGFVGKWKAAFVGVSLYDKKMSKELEDATRR